MTVLSRTEWKRRDRVMQRVAPPDTVTMKCRVLVSRPFTLWDRIRILVTGRVYVSLANAKEHTAVVLSTHRPGEVGSRG